jgi:hypothetical protein
MFDLRLALIPVGAYGRSFDALRDTEHLVAVLGDQRRLGGPSFKRNCFLLFYESTDGNSMASARGRESSYTRPGGQQGVLPAVREGMMPLGMNNALRCTAVDEPVAGTQRYFNCFSTSRISSLGMISLDSFV